MLSGDVTVAVEITDVNEAPVLVYDVAYLDEDAAAGTLLLSPSTAYDPDADTFFIFELVAAEAGGSGGGDPSTIASYFDLDEHTGALSVSSAGELALDYETMPNYTVTVAVFDNGIPTGSCFERCKNTTAQATILVNDINEAPSFTTNRTQMTVLENASIGTFLAELGWTDPDRGQVHYFGKSVGGEQGQITSDDADTMASFEFYDSLSPKIVTKTALDFESKLTYTFTAAITDEEGLSGVATVEVTTIDTNDRPSVASDVQTLSVAENYVGSIGTFLADDEDCCFSEANPSWGLLSFTLDDDSNVEFETLTLSSVKTSAEVSVTTAFDYEVSASHSITVTVTDGGGYVQSGTLTIAVENVNDAPTFVDAACPLTAYISDG